MTKHLSVLTLALALATAAPLSASAQDDDTFTRGVAAYESGDYERAAGLWEPLAEDGEPEAQRNLAQLYRLGLGVEKDDERAYALYVAAAEQNSVDAQVNVAFLLLTGEGVEKDSKQAALWFAKAADQGDALAQFNLGLMYEKGVGVPQDADIARELYQLSANQGQTRALARLDAIEGDLPPDGGTTARREQAEEDAQERAADAAADRERARQDADVQRVQDRAAAEKEAEKSAKVEKAEVEAKTGPILMFERIEKEEEAEAPAEPVEPDPVAVAALENAEAAFASTTKDAPYDAPLARRKPRVEAPAPRTATLAPAAAPAPAAAAPTPAPMAESGLTQRMRQAEAAYRSGDFATSSRLLMPLAREGVPSAQFLLGRMFNRGEGVTLDHFEAYSLWRSAAANGSERAATALANFSTRFAPSELARAEENYQALQRWLARQNRN